jgi:MFS family permease
MLATLGSAGRVVVPFSAGYVVSYLFRTVNAVIAPDLVGELGLSPGDLGLLTSIYFLTFAGAQVPLGLLLDRFGPRRVQGALLVVASVGAACFGAAGGLPALLAGRALIGLGVAGGLSRLTACQPASAGRSRTT